jgi:hypothetical protein
MFSILSPKKKCSKCGEWKDKDQFGKDSTCKDGLRFKCKSCTNSYNAKYRSENADLCRKSNRAGLQRYKTENGKFIRAYLETHPCVDCGENDPVVLEFDHITGMKKFNIGHLYSKRTLKTVQNEISKCVIRCANCHRRKTAKERKWYLYSEKPD